MPIITQAKSAAVVIDEDGTVLHSQLVDEITSEPDYDAAIAATGNTAERAYLTRKRGELV